MNWYFKDSKGTQGPLTERQLRILLATESENTATVRGENSNWVPASVAREKFSELDRDGIYLRSDDKILGPYVASRAVDLQRQKPNYFDSYKVGKEGKWKPIEDLQGKSERQTAVVPPPIVRQLPPPLPQIDPPVSQSTISESIHSNLDMIHSKSLALGATRRRTKKKPSSILSKLGWFLLVLLVLWGGYFVAFRTNALSRLPINLAPMQIATHEVGVDSLLFEFKLSDVEPANGTGFQLLAEAVSNTSVGDMSYAASAEMRQRAQSKGRDIRKLEIGTRVLHLKTAIMMNRYILQYVRILGGPLAGKEGWVLDAHLKANL